MRPRLPENLRRRLAGVRGWLIPAALLALVPKCALCLLAYAGLGAAFGLGGPEICGATNDAAGHWTIWLASISAVAGAVGFLRRRPRPLVSRRYNTTGLSTNQPKSE